MIYLLFVNKMIRVYLIYERGFIWNAEDVHQLRAEHRILGTLVGCLPRNPRQNVHLGLPLQLTPEEVTLLLDKGLAELYEQCGDLPIPSSTHVTDFEEYREQLYSEQAKLFQEERRKQILHKIPEIQKGRPLTKKRKLARSLKAATANQSSVDDKHTPDTSVSQSESGVDHKHASHSEVKGMEDGDEDDDVVDVDDIVIPQIHPKHTFIQFFTETPWKRDDETLAHWNYPITERECLRCKVFREFWERGYYLTTGAKFGGDFLVYPGDPVRYHSFFIAVCLPHDKALTPLDLIMYGRLGSNVKKTVVMCSFNKDTNSIVFTSLQWSAIT